MKRRSEDMNKYSQWFPYRNVQDSYNNLSQALDLPRKICDYLLDAPQGDYVPVDDNEYSRCRFWKYLFHDGARPLTKELPTIKEKMGLLFNPDKPTEPPTAKGYRLIPQVWVKQSQTDAQTRVYVYCGREVPNDSFKLSMSIHFMIWSNYTYESNTKEEAYSRTLAIEQALIEAFVGVNMTGLGVFGYNKRVHPDCGSRPLYDGDTNVGRELVLGLELMTTALNEPSDFNNMIPLTANGTRLA